MPADLVDIFDEARVPFFEGELRGAAGRGWEGQTGVREDGMLTGFDSTGYYRLPHHRGARPSLACRLAGFGVPNSTRSIAHGKRRLDVFK